MPDKETLEIPAKLWRTTAQLQCSTNEAQTEPNFFTGGDRELFLRLLKLQNKRMLRIKNSQDGTDGANSSSKQVKKVKCFCR